MTASPCAVLTIGETMALIRSENSLDENGARLTLGIGGSESNVAIGLSRLGQSCRWVTSLGADPLGDLVASTVTQEGVVVRANRVADAPTGLMLRGPHSGTQRDVLYFRTGSAASTLAPSIVEDADWIGVQILHLTGITAALSASSRHLVTRTLAEAQTRGVTTSFDVNHRERLWSKEEARRFFTGIIGNVDVVFGDAEELALLVPEELSPESVIDTVLTLGPREVVLRDGDRGARAITATEDVSLPALPVDVVDTVGAGDAFVAGYLSAVLDGEPVEARVQRGVLCGGLACTAEGDWEGTPTRDEVHAVLLGVSP